MKRTRLVLPLLVLGMLTVAPRVTAQVRITGAISGTVTDNTDAVVPGANVQLKDADTGLQKDTVTNQGEHSCFPT